MVEKKTKKKKTSQRTEKKRTAIKSGLVAVGQKRVTSKKGKAKEAPPKSPPQPSQTRQQPKEPKYYEAVGRRKTAVARVRMWTKGEKEFLVNNRPLSDYFPLFELRQTAASALERMRCLDKFRIAAKVRGGGLSSQAQAIRHATARALILFNPDFRKRLRKVGYLTRDPRMRERKKFGLKRARRAPQWKKR